MVQKNGLTMIFTRTAHLEQYRTENCERQ